MTTERRPANRKARTGVTGVELRLYMVALLAAVYTISWRAIGGHSPATKPVVAPAREASDAQRFVWIDSVPPGLRPPIALPAGWQLASRPQAPTATVQNAQPARVVHVPSRRVPRVRTRSS